MKYLEYRQVAHSDPPRYEFLWGPRAHAETSKMKVLEFLAKVNDKVPSAFSSQYEEALRDEEERARATVPARPGTTGSLPSSTAADDRQELEGAMAPSSPDAGPSCAGSDEGAQGLEEESAGASQADPATQSTRKDPLARKAKILVEILLEKYTKKEPITQNAMKIVSRKYRQHFPEILSTACERVELVFGLEMKEVDRSRNIYTLISKLNLGGNDCPSGEGGLPKSGLLMVLLGVIFMNRNSATEEEIWEFLSMLGIYAGRRHWIIGEPRRLITKDLVQKEYLNYRQVPNSDPPHYEFLWGPRACAETSKMKGSPPSSPAAGDRQELQGAMVPSSPDAEASCAGADQGAQGPEEESADAARAALLARSIRKDPLMRKASMVMDFLLERYTKKVPITKNAMLNVIGRKYKQHFPEILSRASERVELVFGLELKEVDCSRNIYALLNKFTLGVEEGSSDEEELPKSGLLMALLGIIFMKGLARTWSLLYMGHLRLKVEILSPPGVKKMSQSSSATGSNSSTSQGSLEAPSTTSTFSTTADPTSDEEDTSQDEEDSRSSSSTENTYRDTLNSMTILGVIFVKGDCATEEDIWNS
ncbi:hypothetical protein MJG53_019535 [Ovis ammon polii x Ovis aries]|uniref:Uncharacterized protein n=1 Tax=Ovis ammon polii x Ovis aries TaxID=2918886 RepID=A0ACB9U024_9CETA|nr:hypothetical protein MJG53_019535 [Ovis ammon polii x Ovis aries]